MWEKFLPSNYPDLVSRSMAPNLKFCSMKELYFRLCESILIDGGNKINFEVLANISILTKMFLKFDKLRTSKYLSLSVFYVFT